MAIWLKTLAAPSRPASSATGTSQSDEPDARDAERASALQAARALGGSSPSSASASAVGTFAAMAAAEARRRRGLRAPPTIADQRRREHDERETGRRRRRSRRRPRPASATHHAVLQRAPADADHGLEHDGEHRGLQAEEQRRHDADVAEGGIDQLSAMMATMPGRTNRPPAMMPPQVRAAASRYRSRVAAPRARAAACSS